MQLNEGTSIRILATAVAAFALAVSAAASPPDAEQRTLKMRVAVAPLDWSDRYWIDDWQIPVEFRNAIYEKLVKKLHDSGKFVVLERDALEALLKEQAIKEDNTGQSQKGKVVPAQALVKGKVTDFSLRKGGVGGGISVKGINVGASVTEAKMGISVRIFNVDTSEVLANEDAASSVQSTSFRFSGGIGSVFTDFAAFERSPLGEATTKAINQAVEKIIKKLEGQPWTASVADWDADAKELTINAGSDLGVREGDRFEIHRVTRVIKDPETGEILGKRTAKVGVIRIVQVEKKFAIAEVIEGEGFGAGDVVKEIR